VATCQKSERKAKKLRKRMRKEKGKRKENHLCQLSHLNSDNCKYTEETKILKYLEIKILKYHDIKILKYEVAN
jgi:hypothetical protein